MSKNILTALFAEVIKNKQHLLVLVAEEGGGREGKEEEDFCGNIYTLEFFVRTIWLVLDWMILQRSFQSWALAVILTIYITKILFLPCLSQWIWLRNDYFNKPGQEISYFWSKVGLEVTFWTTPQNRKPKMPRSGSFKNRNSQWDGSAINSLGNAHIQVSSFVINRCVN